MNADPSRRSFLKAAAGAAVLPLALGRSAANAAVPTTSVSAVPRTPEKPFVDLAVATICTDGFANRHHEPAFRILPEVGIRNVEFNIWYPDTLTPPYFAGLKERSARANLRPVCVQGSSFGGQGRTGVTKDLGHKIALMYGARELGCRRIKCTGVARGTQGGLKSVIEVCRELAPVAREMDMLILLENHAQNVLENIADYEEIFSAIDSPQVGLCLDTGHFEGVGIDLHAVIEKFHSRILHVDLKDCRERGAGHDTVPFGEGVTDFKAFLTHLQEKDYSGYLVIEMAWAEPKPPLLENLRKARELFLPYVRT